MNNVKSEILFNRGLLWLVIADITISHGANKWVVFTQLALVVFNFWKSFKAYEVE